jgi:hypothetical protein
MPQQRGTLTADEVYALTAYLLFINQVIPEDQVLDRESLPKVKMPLGEDEYASLPDWKPKTRRLKDYLAPRPVASSEIDLGWIDLRARPASRAVYTLRFERWRSTTGRVVRGRDLCDTGSVLMLVG